MGRVARYKKVKACDPFSKKNGGRVIEPMWGMGADGRKPKRISKTVRQIKLQNHKKRRVETHGDTRDAFDAPPQDTDDFDMADLVGSLKKQKPVVLQDEPVASKPSAATVKLAAPTKSKSLIHIDAHEEHASRLLKLEKQVAPKKKTFGEDGRMEGESKKAYQRRVKTEVRQIIRRENTEESNPAKRQRKKDFLNNKKKKRRKGGTTARDDSSDDDVDDDESATEGAFVTGEQALAARARATAVRFGEQAERPPVFRVVPRGATKKLEFKVSNSNGKMTSDEIASEQSAMEKLRLKVQAQYRLIKSKRKQTGNF
jgi:hypothetical protein